MKSCAFFGHRYFDKNQYRDKMFQILTCLIENRGVTQFYSGFRGNFDRLCANAVCELKTRYPQIKNTLVLSYIPEGEFTLPKCFDDSVYLITRRIPKRFAITETNKLIVDKADIIVAGVALHGGGAYAACEYAAKKNKPIINLIDGV